VKAYLKTFVLGFLKYFKLEDYPQKEKLFLEFIVLSFPKEKLTSIIDVLKAQKF
jgi:hypothetical protein